MENKIIVPTIRLGQSVKSKVRSLVYGSVESSIWESVSNPVDISMRSSVRSLVSSSVWRSVISSVWEPIRNSTIWRIRL